MVRYIPLVSAPVLFGIAVPSTAQAPSDGYARLGRWVPVDGPRLRPDKVIADSRCPENARCIWAGEVKVAVTVKGGRWIRRLMLTQGQPVHVADGTLTLTEVLPGRRIDRVVKPRDYRFRFRFDGGLNGA